jgi:type I restriction enzyme, S subunit
VAPSVKKSGLTPTLRFPEFRDAKGWAAIPLNQKNRDEKIVRVLTNSAEFGVMDQRDYFDKDIATQGKLDSYFVVELGDYVYNPRISTTAPVGPLSKNNIANGVMSPLYTVFRFKNRNDDFYAHYFKTTGWHAYLRQASSTGARHDRMAISNDAFIAMPLPVASPEEQQKIAECLNSVDELIAAQARKLDALKTHKKGLMQQLFPREGETQPRLRFPEFQAAGEWEEKTLGEIVEVASGQVDPTKPPYCDMPHIGGENIESHTGALQGVRTARELGFISGKYLFDVRDVLYSKIRPALNKVAIPDFEGICSADIYPLRPSNQKLCRQYLAYLLLSAGFLEYATKHSDRSKIPKVNRDSLLAYELVIPCRPEQQRIADCLITLDDLIAAQTQKLDALKTHKKGLMQQLFPSPEEVEG